jgi:hypothetical protein
VTGPALGVPGHRVALVVWSSMLVMLLLFLAVVLTLGPPSWAGSAVPPDLLLGVVVATSAIGVALSRVLPRRMTPRQDGARPEITALTRLILSWSFCEAVAIFPLIAYLLTRDWRLLAVFFADLAALVAYCPTAERWGRLTRAAVVDRPRRMVR